MEAQPESPAVTISTSRDDAGRWVAEVLGLDGARASGATHYEALSSAAALALRDIADRLERHEPAALALATEIFQAIEDEIDIQAAEAVRHEPTIPWEDIRDEL